MYIFFLYIEKKNIDFFVKYICIRKYIYCIFNIYCVVDFLNYLSKYEYLIF